jgi:hypothetical protein
MTTPTPPKVEVQVVPKSTTGVNLSAGSFVGIILFVVGICAAAYIYASVGKKDALTQYTQEFKAYQDTVVKPTLAQAERALVLSDSLKKLTNHANVVAAQQTDRINILKTNAQALGEQNQTLLNQLGTLPDTGDINILVRGLADERDTLKLTIIKLEGRDSTRLFTIREITMDRDTTRAALLRARTTIIDIPKPPAAKKIFGFLPQLTAKQAVIATAIISLYVGYKVHP